MQSDAVTTLSEATSVRRSMRVSFHSSCLLVIIALFSCASRYASEPCAPTATTLSEFERLPQWIRDSLARQYFPRDPAAYRVTLERTNAGCGGKSPVFTLVVDGHGGVEYTGQANVEAVGHLTLTIATERLRVLHEQFALIDFLQLREEYGLARIGPPDSILTLEIDGRSHRVVNRWLPGMQDGDPTELQNRLWELSELVIDTTRARESIRR